VNYIRLPGVFQCLARGIERAADGANCRIIENTYGNEPKNRQQVHATPACTRQAPCWWRNRTGIRRSLKEFGRSAAHGIAGIAARLWRPSFTVLAPPRMDEGERLPFASRTMGHASVSSTNHRGAGPERYRESGRFDTMPSQPSVGAIVEAGAPQQHTAWAAAISCALF
jgi:hypothetical protein